MTDLAAHIARQEALLPLARELGRAVARQVLPIETARSYLIAQHPDCPVGLSASTGWALNDSVRDTERALASAESRVRSRVWPLCQDRKPGREILDAAHKIGAPLREWELLDLCRTVARQTQQRRRAHG